MSDKLITYPIDKLLRWMLNEEQAGHIFGIAKELFFRPSLSDPFRMQRYGQILETPIGVAAGPHTQLAQNIVSAWLCGARYIELKTVQVLDEIEVSKPCIDMEDEGYNCEWSQELTIEQSFDQYIDAWILIHLLRHHFGRQKKEAGFLFNMSVGYDMQGILSDKIQNFLDRISDCHIEKAKKIESLASIYPAIADIPIPDRISDNVTLSTMHGCPADEIEQIARYLIEERGLHTTIKLNPTLLGVDELRRILHNHLHYDVRVPDEAFEHDLKYDDALGIIRRLQKSAGARGVSLALKLTNTLETVNSRGVLPQQEKMVYMSGRALHPISVALAAKLQADFEGELDISFSAGGDCFNTPDLIAAGLTPVTVCSDLLKPGGYGRLGQYLSELASAMAKVDANSIDDFILKRSFQKGAVKAAALDNLEKYAERVADNPLYHKTTLPEKSIKTPRALTTFDCIQAPCLVTCPAHQDVPEYMHHTANGDYAAAFTTVMRDNPFPTVTGLACDHACQSKCTRQNIDAPLRIRDVKRFISEQSDLTPHAAPGNGTRVAIIGAGPSGLSCAWYLALAGFSVHVYESTSHPGGMLAHAIPRFRLPDAALRKDIERIKKLGVVIHENGRVDAELFRSLQREYDYLYIAVGAGNNKKLGIPGEELPGVYDALEFLAAARDANPPHIGRRVAVIGGGDSAVDAARTAKRLVPEEGQVMLIYRRTIKEMPANSDEKHELMQEGIEIIELATPVRIVKSGDGLTIKLQKMQLGDADASGRRRPLPIPGALAEIKADAMVSAIGQDADLNFLPDELVAHDDGSSSSKNVFLGGDARRGPATIIAAIADGHAVADKIIRAQGGHISEMAPERSSLSSAQQQIKMATREFGLPQEMPTPRLDSELAGRTMNENEARAEAARCLLCDEICNVCVSVCPNRANIAYDIEPGRFTLPNIVIENGNYRLEPGDIFSINQTHQVLNIVDFCNECGNCTTFCPTSGAPWRDKPRVCLSDEAFQLEESAFKFELRDGVPTLISKENGRIETLSLQDETWRYETDLLIAKIDRHSFQIKNINLKNHDAHKVSLKKAAEMSVLLEAMVHSPWQAIIINQ